MKILSYFSSFFHWVTVLIFWYKKKQSEGIDDGRKAKMYFDTQRSGNRSQTTRCRWRTQTWPSCQWLSKKDDQSRRTHCLIWSIVRIRKGSFLLLTSTNLHKLFIVFRPFTVINMLYKSDQYLSLLQKCLDMDLILTLMAFLEWSHQRVWTRLLLSHACICF